MYKSILLILSIFFISCSNTKNKSTENIANTKKIDTLKYSYRGFNNGLILNLLSNENFEYQEYFYGCLGGGERKKVFGTYKFDKTNLTLIPSKIKLITYPMVRNDKPDTLKIDYGVDSLKIKTQYTIITWGNANYVLTEQFDVGWNTDKKNDYMRFSENYNSGAEPERSGRYLKDRQKDTLNVPLDLNQIPKKWRKLFLKNPLSAKIISSSKKIISGENGEFIYWILEIDKGTKDNVSKGMIFQTESGDCFFEIDSIGVNRSFTKAFPYMCSDENDLSIGAVFQTKWE
ncbi:hypothetical protein H2O64_05130 [Kordia sp. YSTF-M3]|uniref:Uncharacterized protein n=1 Tax=Kordia aestuariivivens TaxID=2759037 RepID=A0ABR7Q6H4_9FLAO|nr:hypothetical protein [Kordia aestuariivivens]MBC8754043.1 hypothetical protein [Kordia aestuariivivens]